MSKVVVHFGNRMCLGHALFIVECGGGYLKLAGCSGR
mgnify:FL=1